MARAKTDAHPHAGGGKQVEEERDPRTYAIIGAGMEVHKELCPGYDELLVREAFEIEMGMRGIPFEREKNLKVHHKGIELKRECCADYLCFGEVVVEAKCLPQLTIREEAQLLKYLKAARLHVGLLVNFGAGEFQWRRMVV
jgi:GxxExxY protein